MSSISITYVKRSGVESKSPYDSSIESSVENTLDSNGVESNSAYDSVNERSVENNGTHDSNDAQSTGGWDYTGYDTLQDHEVDHCKKWNDCDNTFQYDGNTTAPRINLTFDEVDSICKIYYPNLKKNNNKKKSKNMEKFNKYNVVSKAVFYSWRCVYKNAHQSRVNQESKSARDTVYGYFFFINLIYLLKLIFIY
jgi:anthranilate/para-aminobenzoate synthase component I